jgi:CRP-like cAMP-binding protein
MKFTICRNLAAALSASHFWACAIYFLARLRDFDDTTWFGPLVREYSGFSRFIVSLYWGVMTFSTVGYGDYTPTNSEEQILGIIAVFVNLVIAAWIIGSMTLLIVKNDEMTGEYRDALQTLTSYSKMHGFDKAFQKKLEEQLRLEFNNREISDERVLSNFPSSVRRRILRKLYLKYLWKTELMKDVRQQFVDAFLNNCRVEIFSPGEEIVERGSISSDLFLLVGGMASVEDELLESDNTLSSEDPPILSRRNLWQRSKTDDSSVSRRKLSKSKTIEAGEFIGEIGFFTESPQGTYTKKLFLAFCTVLSLT